MIREYLMMGKLIALLGLIAIICWQSSQIHRWHKQADGLSAKLEAISTAKNTQKAETRQRVITVVRTIKEADAKARQVEQAPLPGGCRTPDAILQADI